MMTRFDQDCFVLMSTIQLMYTLIVLHPIISVQGSSDNTNDHFYDRILQYKTERLNYITLEKINTESFGSCALHCVNREKCLSFLYEDGTCQLLDWYLDFSDTFSSVHSPVYFGQKLRSDVARGKPANLSSTHSEMNQAGIAVDGVVLRTDGQCDGMTHTVNGDEKPWWRVDLLQIYRIVQITWIGRQQSELFYRQEDIEITVGNTEDNITSPCAYFNGPPTVGRWNTVNCPPNTMGRFVQFKRPVFTVTYAMFLELCEVIVKVIS